MASILKLQRAAPPPPSAARAKLAEAIADLNKAQAEISAMSRILDNGACGWEATRAAQELVDTAKANLAAAKQAAAERLMQTALGNADTSAPDIKAARAVLVEAEDALDALRDTRTALEGRLKTLKDSLFLKEHALANAVSDVGREECAEKAQKLIGELYSLHALLVDKHAALAFLVSSGFIAENRTGNIEGIGELASRATYPMEQWRASHMPIPSPSRNAWHAAIEALKTDATAQLPEAI